MPKLSVRDLEVQGKRVLVRVDFNVPVEEKDGHIRITDDTRMRESLPTIAYLREKGAKVILMAHFGRPKGQRSEKDSLRPVADHLHSLIQHSVAFSHDVIGEVPEKIIAHMHPGDVALLENVRFHAEEEKNDEGFAAALAKLGDVYVNDAFGAAHRAHASTAAIARHVAHAAMGLLMEKELQYLKGELEKPARPFLVILGGAKVSDKINVIKALMEKADVFLVGGAMAYTFYKAKGIPTGKSRVEADKLDLAREILELATGEGRRVRAPGRQSRDPGIFDQGEAPADAYPFAEARASPMAGRRSTSGRKRSRSSSMKSAKPRRSCGMARSAFSRWRPLPAALARSPKPWPTPER